MGAGGPQPARGPSISLGSSVGPTRSSNSVVRLPSASMTAQVRHPLKAVPAEFSCCGTSSPPAFCLNWASLVLAIRLVTALHPFPSSFPSPRHARGPPRSWPQEALSRVPSPHLALGHAAAGPTTGLERSKGRAVEQGGTEEGAVEGDHYTTSAALPLNCSLLIVICPDLK